MAKLNYSVILVDATGLQVKTLEGSAAYDAFEVRSEELLKQSMNQARKAFRQAAPTRTGKMKRSFRVSRIRRKRDRETGGRIVIGYQVSTGRRQFYASITDRRQDTIVANWFNDVFEEVTNSPEFLAWQKEVVRLFVDVIRAEFRELARTTWRANFISGFPSAKVIFSGPSGSLIRAELSRGR